MKKIFLVLLTIFMVSCSPCSKEYRLTGKIVDLYRTEAGYKISPKQYCVFYSDSLKRNLCLYVTINTYVNLKVGENTTFIVTDYELRK